MAKQYFDRESLETALKDYFTSSMAAELTSQVEGFIDPKITIVIQSGVEDSEVDLENSTSTNTSFYSKQFVITPKNN